MWWRTSRGRNTQSCNHGRQIAAIHSDLQLRTPTHCCIGVHSPHVCGKPAPHTWGPGARPNELWSDLVLHIHSSTHAKPPMCTAGCRTVISAPGSPILPFSNVLIYPPDFPSMAPSSRVLRFSRSRFAFTHDPSWFVMGALLSALYRLTTCSVVCNIASSVIEQLPAKDKRWHRTDFQTNQNRLRCRCRACMCWHSTSWR